MIHPRMHPQVAWQALLAGLVYVLLATALYAAPVFPPLTGRVVDDAGILSAETQQKLTQMLAQHEAQTGNQIVIATIKSLQGYSIDDFGYQLGRAWGIGQKGQNNGALLLVAPNERNVRVEVGYGLEGRLTDAQSRLIIENLILPEFRKGDFNTGVLVGATTLLRVLGGDASALPQQTEQRKSQDEDGSGGGSVIAIIVIMFIFGRFFWPLLFLGGFRGRHGGPGRGGFSRGGFSGGGGSFGGGGASGRW
jgi:uncharacterized protein